MMAFKVNNFLLIFLSGVVSVTLAGKLRYQHDSKDKLSSLETILLRDKLNLLLDAESKEMTLLKNLLEESHEVSSEGGELVTVEKNELDKEHKSESSSWTAKASSWSTTTVPPKLPESGSSLAYLRDQGIVSKLEENSKRMEKMVVFLVDLRNLLTEALTAHDKQNEVESELVEIREEMEYLRKELHSLKKGPQRNNPNLENKLHNDETTIAWLTESTKELRREVKEISESCNITVMLQMKEQFEENRRKSSDLASAEKELEEVKLKQLRQTQEISEAKANIEDLRSWQVKMGKKIIGSVQDDHESEERSNLVDESVGGEEHFITEALKESVGKPTRHNKRLKAKVHELQSMIEDLVQNNKKHQKRLVKLENSQRFLKTTTSTLRETLSQAGFIPTISTDTSRTKRHTEEANLSKKVGAMEKTMQDYLLTLENLNDKVGAVEELQESSTQLFRSLETLETKYDERVTELQTAVARMESSVSNVKVVNEDLKEQQSQQSTQLQSVKKELFETKGKLQTNHLRLASIQSQLVKWAAEKCSNENSESIQNIRIATLEEALQDSSKSDV